MSKKVLVLCYCVAVGMAEGQPSINPRGIVNAASYADPELPNGSVAQGSIFVIRGYGLGPASLVSMSTFPLPAAQGLSGTTVTVWASGQSLPCILLSTSATQVTAILPSRTPPGSTTLTVTYNGETSAPQTIQVVPSSFGIFALHQTGSGPALVQNVASATGSPLNSVFSPARSGQKIIIYGTGLGPIAGDETSVPIAKDLRDVNVEVFIGDRLAAVDYRGRSACCAGLDQITAIVPEGVDGCYVPLAVKIGDTVSNYTSVAISDNEQVCKGQGPGELTSDELLLLKQQGQLRTGRIFLDRLSIEMGGGIQGEQEIANAVFSTSSLSTVERSCGLLGLAPAMGTCTVPGDIALAGNDTAPGLAAGSFVRLATVQNGINIYALPTGRYNADLSAGSGANNPLLVPGSIYISNGIGGSSVEPFSVDFPFPAPATWSESTQYVSLVRRAGIEVTWANPEPNAELLIYGSSSNGNTSAAFICRAQGAVSRFQIPPHVLLGLPITNGWGNGLLAIVARHSQRFNAPGLDVGLIEGVNLAARIVTYR